MEISRAMMTPEITSGIIYVHTFETCQRSHQAIGGCTPVEYTVLETKSTMFSDRECSLFSVSLSFGGEGRGREARLDECCISNDVCLESVGALPPFIGNNRSTLRTGGSRNTAACPGVWSVGRWMLPRGTSTGLKCLGHLPIFNTPRLFPDTPKVIPVTPRVIGRRQRYTAQGGFPV